MQEQPGLFITIEGIDDAGKAAQCSLLRDRFEAAGYDVLLLSFPRYHEPSSYFVREYLRGTYGPQQTIGPYTASLFYTLDRYQAAPAIRQALAHGTIVIADRFMSSSLAYQGVKIQHPEERRGFFVWLDNLEYYMLDIPRPALNLVLHLPADALDGHIQQQTGQAGVKTPSNEEQLQQVSSKYAELCALFPKDFTQIDCIRDQQLLDAQTVHNLIWGKVSPLLPADKPSPAPEAVKPAARPEVAPGTLFVPPTLTGPIRQQYLDAMTELTVAREQLASRLGMYIAEHPASVAATEQTANQLVPAALFPDLVQPESDTVLAQLIASHLPSSHATASEDTRLVRIVPRNELDVVAEAVYPRSDRSLAEMQRDVATWSYEQKVDVLRMVASTPFDSPALVAIRYTWDCTTSLSTYRQIQQALTDVPLEHQALSPRLGYQTPEIIEQAELSEAFDHCFDLSLALYSQLQQAGLNHEAQYTVLLGHRVHWTVTLTLQQLSTLLQKAALSVDNQLLTIFLHSIAEVHPIIGEALASLQRLSTLPAEPTTITPEAPLSAIATANLD